MTDSVIHRLNAALEGRYRVERELGEGGMATVYLAEDVRHRRSVAVKVLRPELAAVVGAERFLAEIETTANLQHPHILPLFDSGEADGFVFYVMPYVEGDSLRERLDREKQLRVDEAVSLTRKIADALDYAHEKGVVHRDIKPANILLSARGEPLVADFGIALAVSQAGGGRITETGLSLGTPHYMSPEQATGDRDIDPRSDVYALGCVLYEMLAGQPPFAAPTAQAVLARILTEDPRRVTDVRRTVPPHVAAAVARALEKLPADRFDGAAELRAALDDESFRYEPVRSAYGARSGRQHATATSGAGGASGWDRLTRSPYGFGLMGAGFIGMTAVAAVGWMDRPVEPVDAARALPAWRFDLEEAVIGENGLDLAPDGTLVLGEESGEDALRVRQPGDARFRRLPGTEGGFHPTVSPDGEWVAFTTGPELRKVPLRGGPVVSLARTPSQGALVGPHWGPDGTIAVATVDGLYRVPDVGGTLTRVYESRDGVGGLTPLILPDGAGWLFTEGQGFSPSDPVLKHLDPETGETKTLMEGGGSALWLPTGDVVFVHTSGSLFAAPFDLDAAEFLAEPAPVVDSLRVSFVVRPFVASVGGGAAYVLGGVSELSDGRIVLVDVTGEGRSERPPLEPATHWDGRFSPDGRGFAYTTEEHIRFFDLSLGTNLRLTTEGTNHHDPVWSPDGSAVVFASQRDSSDVDLWVKDADGDGPARLLLQMEGTQYPREWTRDGTLLVQTNHAGNWDLYTVPADGSAEPRPYLRADWDETLARVSPDGRWLAYVSEDTERPTIVVRSFPEPGRGHRVTEAGATGRSVDPVWSPDGRFIYYLQDQSTVIAAEVATDPDFRVVSRREIGQMFGYIRDVHPDGDRLLTFQFGPEFGEEGDPTRLVVVANWFSELEERLGERTRRRGR